MTETEDWFAEAEKTLSFGRTVVMRHDQSLMDGLAVYGFVKEETNR